MSGVQIFMHSGKKIVFQVVFKLDRLSFGKPDLYREKKSCIQCTNWKWFCYHELQMGTSSLSLWYKPPSLWPQQPLSLSPFSAITTTAGTWLVRYGCERIRAKQNSQSWTQNKHREKEFLRSQEADIFWNKYHRKVKLLKSQHLVDWSH